jgi:hypothetical protein
MGKLEISLIMCAASLARPAVGEMTAEGIWADEDKQHVYAFLDNHQMRYWSKTKYSSDPAKTYNRSDGTWQSKETEPMCWIGKRSGNVMLYANSQQCCMAVQMLGNKLILNYVWGEPAVGLGLCENRVLTKIESTPSE